MRVLAALAFMAQPACAWEFTALPICTLSRDAPEMRAKVTYEGQIYALRLDHPEGWPEAAVFSIRFVPNGPVISTTRHRVTGTVLEVTDSGFGNVLNGLQFNQTAIAELGDIARPIDLSEAADPVAAFRDCDPAPLS